MYGNTLMTTETRTCVWYAKKRLVDGTIRQYPITETYIVKAGAHTIKKLSDVELAEIREDYRRGVPLNKIGARYGVGVARVKRICAEEVRG